MRSRDRARITRISDDGYGRLVFHNVSTRYPDALCMSRWSASHQQSERISDQGVQVPGVDVLKQ